VLKSHTHSQFLKTWRLGRGNMDWIGVAQAVPVEGSCEHDDEPPGSIKCWDVLV
jgi:hypothetical protein